MLPPPKRQISDRRRRRRELGLLLLVVLLALSFLASLSLGSVSIPLSEVLTILAGEAATKATWQQIILQLRLPKALTAIFAGAALSISGLQIQALFRNPLAGPSILGINAGASLAVALGVLTVGATENAVSHHSLLVQLSVLQELSIVLAASLGAAATMGLVLIVAQRVKSSLVLLIFGLMFGYTTTALVTILLHFSVMERTQTYLTWTFGSFGGVTWNQMGILIPMILVGLGIAIALAPALNLLLLGEDHARSLGVAVAVIRSGVIISASILAGTVTAFCGPIAFLGVAVPHLCRSLFQTVDHRVLVPASLLSGAILALFADVLAQLPGSQMILPLNAVTVVLGAPVITTLILKRRSFGV
jgi:iron complex transport system permease protein